jgi:hypothetical protein
LGGVGCASGRDINQQVSDGGGSSESSASSMGGGDAGSGGEGVGAMGADGGGGAGAQGGAGGMDPCASGCPADTWDIDNNPLTGECGCEYACAQTSQDDPIDELFTDDNCDGTDGVVEDCVFVSAADGTSGGVGTRLDPVDTIQNGIAAANTASVSSVCVSGETYGESVTMISGINVYGGFDHEDVDFKFRRKSTVTSLVQASGTVFLAENINQETHIAGLKIEAFTPGTPGASTYGVRLTGGSAELFVELNDIHAFVGAAGANGSNGTAHGATIAAAGGDGGDACEENDNPCAGNDGVGGVAPGANCDLPGGDGGDGIMGGHGEDGDNAPGGTPVGGGGGTRYETDFDNGCGLFDPGAAVHGSAAGNNSNHGLNGFIGAKGDDRGTVSGGVYVAADGGGGTVGGDGAGGPGGGAGGGEYHDFLCGLAGDDDRGAGGGAGGCGGEGGALGGGGGGGGGSFGIFASGGTVRVLDNIITTDGGGDGGDGGSGQAGQDGGDGGNGGLLDDDSGNGGDGGAGSNGGDGGPGGGGGGGPSAILAFTGGVIFTLNGNIPSLGAEGDGGTGGTNATSGVTAPNGDDGVSGNTIQL